MIAIDTTFFAHSEAAGGVLSLSTSIFTADLLDAFAASGQADKFALIVSEGHKAFFRHRFPQYRLIIARWFPTTLLRLCTGGKINATRWVKRSGAYARIVRRSGASAVWFPFATPRTFVETRLPAIVTIHDLYRLHHGTEEEAAAFRALINNPLNNIVCVSSATAADVRAVQSYANAERNIPVIPNSVDLDTSEQEAVEGLSGGYILDINAYIDKKNPMTLLAAYNSIKARTELPLVFCGGYKDDDCYRRMEAYIAEHGLEKRVKMLLSISAPQRNWLLTHAVLFVTPSLYEGWGRTPVEAAICGIPVISTKETSLMEATMGLVRYVNDPMSISELSGAIMECLSSPPEMQQRQQIANTLRSSYSPNKCATEYLKVFNTRSN